MREGLVVWGTVNWAWGWGGSKGRVAGGVEWDKGSGSDGVPAEDAQEGQRPLSGQPSTRRARWRERAGLRSLVPRGALRAEFGEGRGGARREEGVRRRERVGEGSGRSAVQRWRRRQRGREAGGWRRGRGAKRELAAAAEEPQRGRARRAPVAAIAAAAASRSRSRRR